jgi:hypothetical protein
VWSIAPMRNRNRCRPSKPSRSPQIWRFFVASVDFGTRESSASGGAGSESSSSLMYSTIFSALCQGGWMPGKDRGVGPPSASRPGQPPTLAPFSSLVSAVRTPEVSGCSSKSRVQTKRHSALQSHEILRGLVWLQPPLKDQPIGRRQAVPHMVETFFVKLAIVKRPV